MAEENVLTVLDPLNPSRPGRRFPVGRLVVEEDPGLPGVRPQRGTKSSNGTLLLIRGY